MASQPLSKAAPMPARPYRRFVLPSMHRRFTNAAVLSLVACFIDQLSMGAYKSAWQSLGTTTVRCSLLFISILSLYVLRVANMHVGSRTALSPAHDIYTSTLSMCAVRCFMWYQLSAWVFCETYIWSVASDADLGIIDPGKLHEPIRLNERPIFLRSLFFCLAVTQTAIHLFFDYDHIPIPSKKPALDLNALARGGPPPFAAPIAGLQERGVFILARAFRLTFLTVMLGPFCYWLFIRHRVWSWSFWVAQAFYNLTRSSAILLIFPPGLPGLTARFLVQGFLLASAWEIANFLFDICLAQEPMKQGRLLTDESLDPNGTLLNGLKTARPIPRTFAFWELELIAQHYGPRRELIFRDIDRPGGSTWSQILTVTLGEVHAVVKRIHDDKAAATPAPVQAPEEPLPGLPKLGTPIKDENIFTKARPIPFAELRGNNRNNRFVESTTAKLIDYAAHQAHVPQNLSKDSVNGLFKITTVRLLHTVVGIPFRQTVARRVSSVVLGTPASNISTLLDSIVSISKLVVHSKKEDRYGTVYRDVPNIIRTFTSTYNSIESFTQTVPVHWTDVEFEPEDRKVPDVQLVLQALQDALREIVNEFGEFSDSMGLSSHELRLAKEVVAKSGGAGEDTRRIRG